jgi:phospholipase/carboxylesterase
MLSLVHERRPAVRAPGVRAPLLLLLHGVGSNERSMARLAPSFDERYEVLSVRSPIELGPGSYAWFHVEFTAHGPVIEANEARAGWEQIARFAEEAVVAYDADPALVFVGGFSQGGIMSLAALLTAPSLFAGAVCMSGRLLPEVLPYAASAEALRDTPVLILHGTDDTKLGIAFARSARERLAAFPLALAYHELAMGHEVTSESAGIVAAWLTERLDA